jgi:DnaK suppressor protein
MENRKRTAKKRSMLRPKADTKQILGNIEGNTPIEPKWHQHYQRLMELRTQLFDRKENRIKDAKTDHPIFSLHMADAGTDEFDRDFVLSAASSDQESLYEIEQALNRIKNGSYGICELTGKAIEKERLKAIPWTRFSAEAEKQLERAGEVERTRLGERERVLHTRVADKTDEDGEEDS